MAGKRIIGIDFGGTKVAVGVGDDAGHVNNWYRLEHGPHPEAVEIVGRALKTARDLVGHGSVDAIGVSTMGITTEDGVHLAPNVPGWSRLRIPSMIRATFPGIPFAIANDVKAAALAESRWGALRGAVYGLYLNWGTGIAVAFCQHGEVWTGSHGAAGEIAYWWRAGELGAAAGHAPFEEAVGGGTLDREAARRFGVPTIRELVDRVDIDPMVGAFWDTLLDRVASAVGQLLVALDVEVVAVGGGLAHRFTMIQPRLETVWSQYVPFPPQIVCSAFIDQTGLMGALAVGAEAQ